MGFTAAFACEEEGPEEFEGIRLNAGCGEGAFDACSALAFVPLTEARLDNKFH